MVAQLQNYLQVGGVEVINGRRTDSYVELGLVEGWQKQWCFDPQFLTAVPDDGPYNNPVTDPAPWYDANDDDSTHFFGVAVKSLSSELPIERTNASSRRIGRLQTTVRRFTLEAVILADDCCGTDYGKRWLLSQFATGCGSGCATLPVVLAVCGRDGDTVGSRLRDVYAAGIESFEDISPADWSCCWGALVKVVFVAENPYLYGPGIGVLIAGLWEGSGFSDDDCVPWDDCATPTDAACAAPVDATLAPPPLPSLAGPLAPGGTTVPWCNPTFEVSQCVALPALPTFGEAVYRFTIEANGTAMHNARIRVWGEESTFSDADCEVDGPAAFTGQAPLTELRIAYIPEDGILIVDGSTRTVSLYCPDIAEWINADYLIYGANSSFWQHPVIGCGSGALCACATADAENVDPDASFTVEVIPRYL